MRRHRRFQCAAGLAAAAVLLAAGCDGGSPDAAKPTPPVISPVVPPAAPARFTLVASGDVLPYPSIISQAHQDAGGDGYDFHQILAGVKPVVSTADLALCHMEVPYGPAGGPFTGYPLFAAPPSVARALADTGYDGCSTASNHTLDQHFEGLVHTLDTMDAAGLKHTGSARSPQDAGPAFYDVKGVKVAHLAWTYDTNGIALPEGKPWAVDVVDIPRIVEEARAARRAGAQVIVVTMHWGTEWQRKPDEKQLEWAQALTASMTDGRKDIDLVLGTHNHVPQAYAQVNGTWVVYGLGDQVANFPGADKRAGNYGSIARFGFVRDGSGRYVVEKAEFLPEYSDPGPPFRVVDLNAALADPGLGSGTRERYEGVAEFIREAVLSEGAGQAGLTEAGRS